MDGNLHVDRLQTVNHLGGLLYVVVFTVMLFAYRDYLQRPDQPLVGSLPAPTAVMIYGLWPMPIYFMFVYMLSFNRTILTPEDMQAFEELVAARRRRQQESD